MCAEPRVNVRSEASPYNARRWGGLVFAMLFPAFITWGYFVLAERFATGTQQKIYLIVKIIQFAFPAVWTYFALHEPLRTRQPTLKGVLMGIAFGCVVAGAGIVVFNAYLRGTPTFASAAELMQRKIGAFGINSAAKYFVLASFYSLFHSLLEEYYWRWFVFQQLERVAPLGIAIAISGLAFTLHHIVVLAVYFQGQPWLIATFASAIAIGGFFWAWLYHRSGSIFDTWLSHLLIDAGLFFGVGYQLLQYKS